MAQFISKNPNAEVAGFVVQAYINALGKEIEPVATRFGLDQIDPQSWYRLQTLLDLLKLASQGDMSATFDLVKVGKRIGQAIKEAEAVPTTMEDLLAWAPESYSSVHRGGNLGETSAVLLGPGHAELHYKTPYPCDLEFGAAYEFIRFTRPQEMQFSVIHRRHPCKKHGDEECIYDARWWVETDDFEPKF